MARQGTGRATIVDVAELAGVSKSLVSLVLRGSGQVSDHRRAAVLKAAHDLGYRPNAVARGLVQRRTDMIGVLLSDVHNPFFAELVAGLSHAARRTGRRPVMNSSQRSADIELQALEDLMQLQADGVVLAGTVVASRRLNEIGRQVPTVLVARHTTSDVLDSVVTDDVAGAGLAIDHLVSLGHRRIAHVTGGDGAGAAQRRRGFMEAMARHGLTSAARVVEGDYSEAGGITAVDQLFVGRWFPTAVFAANDLAAVGVLEALKRRNIGVPDQVSVVGYDDTWLAGLAHIDLTTVRQDQWTMGATAVELLNERLSGDRTTARHVVLQPGFTIRATTAQRRAGA